MDNEVDHMSYMLIYLLSKLHTSSLKDV